MFTGNDLKHCFQTKEVTDFCLLYECNEDGPNWEIRAHACECDKEVIDNITKTNLRMKLRKLEDEFEKEFDHQHFSLTRY